jgi:hypothetical protein
LHGVVIEPGHVVGLTQAEVEQHPAGEVIARKLGYLFYRSGLVPRWMAMFGLVGGPLFFASAIAVLFGAYELDGAHFLFSIPEIVFEAAITIYTLAKGFRPSPILDDSRYPGVGGELGMHAPG